MSREADCAWAAGLFEGEGSIHILTNRSRHSIGMNSTDEDVLRRFAKVVGAGHINGPYDYRQYAGREHYKPFWSWAATRIDEVEHVYQIISPWLGERRRSRFDEAIEANRVERKRIARPRPERRVWTIEHVKAWRSQQAAGATLREIGRSNNLSGERVRQVLAMFASKL